MPDPQSFDVVVIGGGPGGYVAAIRAAQLGFATACVDDWTRGGGKPALGGTCTNVGCIPSKALLQSSENYAHAGHAFADHGIRVEGLSIDVAKMLARKDKVVAQNNDGITYLFKKNKVASFHGRGSFAGKDGDRWRIAVDGPGAVTIGARHVIVATGSTPRALPGVAFDNERVLDNAGALALPGVPKRLGVVGAGVVGLEMGSVWRRLGSAVTILEALPAFLGAADEAVAKEAQKAFAKQGLAIELWFDMRSRSRRLVPELAGTVGIGGVAAAIVLAADGGAILAAGAWLVIVARAVASLPFVRFQLRRVKHQPHRRWAQDLDQGTAVALAVFGVGVGWLPGVAAGAVVALATVQLVLARTRPPRAVIVGVQQLVLGLAVVITAGLALAPT